MNEFEKFATKGQGIGSATLSRYASALDAYINPTITEERKLNVAQMDVFSRLMMDRIIFLGVPIDDDVANIVMAQLLFLASNDSHADITLYLNTPGGQVSSGLAIYDTMQIVQPDVATVCTGMAASMGSVLLCAGAKGKRTALPHSRVLIHQPLGGAQGQASDILIAAREIEKTRTELFRIIFLGVPIDDDVANIVMAQLLFLASNDSHSDITLYLNTPGGQVSSGLAIYDTMQIVQPDVATVCTGMAASMGSVLLCAGARGKRTALPHSRVLIHQPLGGAQGQASDILIAAREIEKTRTELFRIIAEHSGQPLERVAADGDRDFWMTAEEAKAYGMVDEILYKKSK